MCLTLGFRSLLFILAHFFLVISEQTKNKWVLINQWFCRFSKHFWIDGLVTWLCTQSCCCCWKFLVITPSYSQYEAQRQTSQVKSSHSVTFWNGVRGSDINTLFLLAHVNQIIPHSKLSIKGFYFPYFYFIYYLGSEVWVDAACLKSWSRFNLDIHILSIHTNVCSSDSL